jgi:DNA polymerase epsilon subunit 1
VSGPVMTHIEHLKTKLDKAELRVCAFDIETSKAELKFPDAKFDEIMMISYVVDGKGFLITNRTIIGDDVKDFEYSPKPEYDIGKFTIFNEPDERNMLIKFFTHMRETKPFIYTTFNGDYFDWPFIDERSKKYNLRLEEEIGINVNS